MQIIQRVHNLVCESVHKKSGEYSYKCVPGVGNMFDFDAASAAWKKDTLADNPRALRRKQIKYWKSVADKETKRKRKRPERYGFY